MELHRTDGVLDIDRVRRSKLLFIGAGSLGSLLISNLAYPWRQVVMVDPDPLEEHNVERHLLGYDEVGYPKVEGMFRWLLNRRMDPQTILPHVGEVEDVLDEHTDADLVLVSIDRRRSCDNINAWCAANNLPALYGGVYPLGSGGQVAVIPTPRDVCYLCEEHMMGGEYEGHEVTDYAINPAELVDGLGQPTAVPALRTPINGIASDMAAIALEMLMGQTLAPQVLVHGFDWEPVLNLWPGDQLKAVAGFIGAQRSLGLVPTSRLVPCEPKGFTWSVKRGIVSLALPQWASCPLHSQQVSPEDI